MTKTFKGKLCISFIVLIAFILFAGIMFFLFQNGVFVTPTDYSLKKMAEIPQYDVLKWQYERETEILADYSQGTYFMQDPYVIVDPYDMNPCSALVMFEAEKPGDIEITIKGDDVYSTYRYTKKISGTHYEIPIIGLYAGRENTVILNDNKGNTSELKISTEPLPVDFQTYNLEKTMPEKMEPGVTLFTACFEHSYSALLDNNAQIRGYLSNKNMAHGTSIILLKNGNMLSTGDEYKLIPYNMSSLWEFNWLGKIFMEYEIPNAVHHDVTELPNGDFLAVSNNKDMFISGTREDVVIIIDRKTGNIKKEYDFRKIIDETRKPYHYFDPDIINTVTIDWMHANTAIYDKTDNSIIVSSPIQSQVISIDAETSAINWISGPHEGYDGSAEFLKKYLLAPTGTGFEWHWGQHEPMLLPDFDNNADTIDLLMLDDGQNRSFTEENAIKANDNYSRGVQYRINKKTKTIEQIWQYGKERGAQCYTTFLGDADYLPDSGNRLMAFGGQIRNNGFAVDDIINVVLGELVTNSRVVEVTESGEVVYEVSVWENKYTNSAETYQVERLPLYLSDSFDYELGEVKGERVGESYLCSISKRITAPKFYSDKIGVTLERIYMENGRLVADGNLTYDNKTFLLGRAFFILRSKEATYIYAANSGLNSRFIMSLDTKELKSGTYQLSIAGVVREGNDLLKGEIFEGHIKTGYKITVK
jgi:arylsulfate sulfotransferase